MSLRSFLILLSLLIGLIVITCTDARWLLLIGAVGFCGAPVWIDLFMSVFEYRDDMERILRTHGYTNKDADYIAVNASWPKLWRLQRRYRVHDTNDIDQRIVDTELRLAERDYVRATKELTP